MTAQLRRAPILPSDHPVTRDPDEPMWTWVSFWLLVAAVGAVLVAATVAGNAGVDLLDAIGRVR